MIFMGNGGAKQREDTIAQGLRHIALIAMHRLHHVLQGWIDDAPSLFGTKSFEEVHGALDVSEQYGDGLALAVRGTADLQRSLLGPDAFSQMARGVGDRAGGRGAG